MTISMKFIPIGFAFILKYNQLDLNLGETDICGYTPSLPYFDKNTQLEQGLNNYIPWHINGRVRIVWSKY